MEAAAIDTGKCDGSTVALVNPLNPKQATYEPEHFKSKVQRPCLENLQTHNLRLSKLRTHTHSRPATVFRRAGSASLALHSLH